MMASMLCEMSIAIYFGFSPVMYCDAVALICTVLMGIVTGNKLSKWIGVAVLMATISEFTLTTMLTDPLQTLPYLFEIKVLGYLIPCAAILSCVLIANTWRKLAKTVLTQFDVKV